MSTACWAASGALHAGVGNGTRTEFASWDGGLPHSNSVESSAGTRPDELCIVLLRRLLPLLFLVIHLRKPFGRFCVLRPCTAMAAALHFSAPSSSRCPISACRPRPVQDLVRREDSEYLVGFKEKILLSREEFNETVGSEGPARIHIDPSLKRAGVYRRFIWRLVSLGMLRLSLDSECECGIFCVWKKNGTQRLIVGARSINQRCRRPPPRLCSGDGLAGTCRDALARCTSRCRQLFPPDEDAR